MFVIDYTFTENDTDTPITCQNLSDTNRAESVAGETITLHVHRPGATVLEKSATVTDAANGQFQFDFSDGDLVSGRGQYCEIQFDDGAGGIETVAKFLINVDPEVA